MNIAQGLPWDTVYIVPRRHQTPVSTCDTVLPRIRAVTIKWSKPRREPGMLYWLTSKGRRGAPLGDRRSDIATSQYSDTGFPLAG